MKDLQHTNVRSLIMESGALDRLEALGDYVVTSMEVPWNIVCDQLSGEPEGVLFADSMERDVVERQIDAAPECSTVVAIGGGRAMDLGKYMAHRRGIRLVSVPTVLSVDAFVTPAAGLREEGRVVYVGESQPDPLVIDFEVLQTAPRELNIAGVGDLLSIHTAVFDWRTAARAGKSEYPFSESDCERALRLRDDVMRCADAIRNNDHEGLRAIVEGYLRMNQICLPAGHYRVEEGSEHYLFYELEQRTGRSFVHGPIIGLGIYVMSRMQNNEADRIIEFMDRVGLDYQPKSLGIDRQTLVDSLSNLKGYVAARDDLWYSAIDEWDPSAVSIDTLVDGLRF